MEPMEDRINLIALRGIVRRQKRAFFVIFLLLLFLSAVIAFALPPVYRSQSKILIEGQQIPSDYVKTTVTSYVEERLQMITQQIMSRVNLLKIINRFGLFRDMRERYTTEDMVRKMRSHIKMETISADVTRKRAGRQNSPTIAFTVSYEGKDPATVQKVANELASLYLEQNLKTREKSASNTTAFFQDQLDGLKKKITVLAARISKFKKEHIGELPEYAGINVEAMNRLTRDLNNLDMQIRSLRERKVYLEGQLAGVDPMAPVFTGEGKAVMPPRERLKYLRLELIRLQSTLTDQHPDVIKLKKEIAELNNVVKGSDASDLEVKRLSDLQGKLAQEQGSLGPRHPDVMALKREVEALTMDLHRKRTTRLLDELAQEKPDNPAYINLQTQIASTELELNGLLQQKARIREQMRRYEKRMDNAPLVEMKFNEMTRDYDNAKAAYNELMSKLMEAQVAQGMEETQRGERFTIIEPAQLPEKPYKPNRLVIVLIGFVLAVGAGVGVGALRESLDQSVKTRDELWALTGAPVLSAISLMETAQEKRARLLKRAALSLAGMGAVAVGLFLVHQYVVPLDILWIKIQHRVALGIGV